MVNGFGETDHVGLADLSMVLDEILDVLLVVLLELF